MHKGDYQEGVQNLMTGCCQPGDLDMKKIRIEPNIVEFGSHALPPLESLKKIIPKDALWPPNWDIWEYWGFFYDLQVRHTKLDLNADSLRSSSGGPRPSRRGRSRSRSNSSASANTPPWAACTSTTERSRAGDRLWHRRLLRQKLPAYEA
jgi:hypothetical protein